MTIHAALARQMSRPLFPPPDAAVSLVPGKVMHARFKPKAHRFSYSVFCLLIDLDRLDEAHAASALFSVNRFNLVAFRPGDHAVPGQSNAPVDLADRIREHAAAAGLNLAGGRVLLLAYPRFLGFVFNPISVYFAYDAGGDLKMLVYEVRNTFGEMHTYVAPIEPGQLGPEGLKQERNKVFYVSPFLDMPMRYHFRIRPPVDDVAIRILETDPEGPILSATFHGRRRSLTNGAVLKLSLAMPLMTMKVVAGIHWEALKLWLKGVLLHTRPAPPPPVSFTDTPPPPQGPAPMHLSSR
jgi:uncharacterized protein